MGIPADKGVHRSDAQELCRLDELLDVVDVNGTFLQIRIHGVGVVGQSGDLHALLGAVILDVSSLRLLYLVHIDVGHAGIPALCLALGPAADFHALEAVFRCKVDHLFKGELA